MYIEIALNFEELRFISTIDLLTAYYDKLMLSEILTFTP